MNKFMAFENILDKIFSTWVAYGAAYGTSESDTVNNLDLKIKDLYHTLCFMDKPNDQ